MAVSMITGAGRPDGARHATQPALPRAPSPDRVRRWSVIFR